MTDTNFILMITDLVLFIILIRKVKHEAWKKIYHCHRKVKYLYPNFT